MIFRAWFLLLFIPTLAPAQSVCPTLVPETSSTWQAPLDRSITLRVRDVSLRDALDRIAAVSRIRLTYSAESLPLDRRVCANFDNVAVGAALAAVLSGTSVSAVPTASDHIVLVAAQTVALPEIIPLEKIVVTGSTTGMPRRSLTVGVDVIDGRTLETQGMSSMGEVLRSSVPGVWVWQQSPANVIAQYASVRGASSFGLTYPKIYLDGIELANPLLLTRIAPGSVERIEIIRGPQGAALYGADAISGVVNVITRNQSFDSNANRVTAGNLLGVSSSSFASETVTRQEYSADYQTGTNIQSFAITGMGSINDEFYPDAYGRDISLLARYRNVRPRLAFNATARFFGQEAGNGISPVLSSALPDSVLSRMMFANGDPQRVVQYTLGGTLRLLGNDRWTHTIVAGVDGYQLDNVATVTAALPTALDSALQASRGGADRVTMRASSVARLGNLASSTTSLTLALEHSQLRKEAPEDVSGGAIPDYRQIVSWQQNTGLVGQVNAAFNDQLFLSGGVRFENNEALSGINQIATLPMLGVAYVRDAGSTSIKLRGAFGRGIRSSQTDVRATMGGPRGPGPGPAGLLLDPEVQSGIEIGADVWLGERASLQVTRFDQTASGLIQQVAISTTQGPGPRRSIRYVLQNVGEIANEGWEFEAGFHPGAFSVSANYALVDSRVQQVAFAYTGDLRPGDRMLNVPARTASVTASWAPARWSVSATASRAFDWIGYDRSSLAAAYVDADRPTSGFLGDQLRAYWRKYDGVTWLRAAASFDVTGNVALRAVGENLLNHQQGEPDDITVVPGRTVNLGLTVSF